KRLALAQRMGAHLTIDATRDDVVRAVLAETGGEGADVVCEMSGVPSALHQAFAAVRLGGRVQLLGIPNGEVPVDFGREIIFKRLNHLEGPQAARTKMEGRGEVVILSSNNYLGLCDEPEVVAAGKRALDQFGAGTGSVRFICGTFTIHRELEQALARFVGCESSLTYVSCWNANEGLVPTLLSEQDIVISDQLNHASIIDAIRLAKTVTKCQTAVYRHSDMADLEEKLRSAQAMNARLKLVFTDG